MTSDIRLEWLLTGEGAMLVTGEASALQGPGSSRGGQGAPAVDPLVAELGELRQVGAHGRWARLRQLMTTLLEVDHPMTRVALATACKATQEELQPDLLTLRRLGMVTEADGSYSPTSRKLTVGSTADGSLLALEAIRVILEETLPAADRRDSSGRIVIADVFVKEGDGAGLVARFVEHSRQWLDEQPAGPERVTVVIGVNTGGSHE